MDKLYLSYNQIHETVKGIAASIKNDGYDFDFMIAIGTGGFIPARMLKTFINRPIITVGMAYYDLDDNKMESPVVTQWLDDPINQIKGRKILLVDEPSLAASCLHLGGGMSHSRQTGFLLR